ncbi:hypothetical protein GPJ56_001135 [Histomonas meleagridis]|uniref:uncharacterized protein n=1 Tax=Histomonas meleagridis TaxID=135588 RepID=UPI0035596DA4|nr:hypothetical protein GPJ56_001135 [Histomonas meleagridis]KAH0800350.1 hypothetical protein GO595_006761 [Histomonas meleagridis]
MSNDSQRKIINSNKKIFRTWLIIAAIISAIPIFVIFYLKRDNPEAQNTRTFYTGLITTVVAFLLILNRIRVIGRGKNMYTRGDLSRNVWDKALIDLVGIGLLIEILAIWWEKASFLLIIIPVYFIYLLIKKIFGMFKM